MKNIHRRDFLQTGIKAAMAWPLLEWPVLNKSIGDGQYKVGLIGAGWYGKSDLFRLMQVADVQVIGLCDPDQNMLKAAAELVGVKQPNYPRPKTYRDYREMLAADAYDIILIGSPDHWHALQAIAAIENGANVYLQKPISVDIHEGEAILQAARKKGATVQVGLQRRRTPHLMEAKKNIVDAGLLGKIAHVEMCCYYHMRYNAQPAVQKVPDHLDYDLWTGPAPMIPYNGLPHRRWRGFMEYSNGIMGDMCVHMFDAVRWMLDLSWPTEVSSTGGIYVQKESIANIADTQTAVFHYPALDCVWNHRSWGTPVDPEYPWAFKIYGEKGTLAASVMQYDYTPVDRSQQPIHGDVVYERAEFPEDLTEKDIELHTAPATRGQMKDFLNACHHFKKPIADIEEGHISTASCILANLSMQLGRPLRYDPITKTIPGDEEATRLLARPYREGYSRPVLEM
jgi:predicted dehydrogenase